MNDCAEVVSSNSDFFKQRIMTSTLRPKRNSLMAHQALTGWFKFIPNDLVAFPQKWACIQIFICPKNQNNSILPVVFEGAGDCSGAIEVLKSSSSESSMIPSESVSSAGLEGLALVGPYG